MRGTTKKLTSAAASLSRAEDNDKKTPHKRRTTTSTRRRSTKMAPHEVQLSFGFVSLLLMCSTLASFRVGTYVRNELLQRQDFIQLVIDAENHSEAGDKAPLAWLMSSFFSPPDSALTGTESAAANAALAWVHCDDNDVSGDNDTLCAAASVFHDQEDSSDSDDSDSDDDEEEEVVVENNGIPKPRSLFGQQLLANLADMSQQQQGEQEGDLVKLLLQQAAAHGWSLMSYYMHSESPVCILLFQHGRRIVLNKSTKTLDIYSSQSQDDESLLDDWLESLVSSNLIQDNWAFEPRGTPYDPTVVDAGLTDLYNGLLGALQFTYKRLVVRDESPFQEVAIYDTIDPRLTSYHAYQQAKANTSESRNNYYTQHAHMFQPDRQMFLDGVVQSRKHGERAYHEALVHPAMLMHPHPERVAIVGAGEGATLREVLKHSCLKQVIMIEIDQHVMDLSRQHLAQWNDCSDLILPEGMVNPSGNCFDDPRATVYSKDAIQWFMERYPAADSDDGNNAKVNDLFDVIIMDALDPGDKVEFSDMLFDNTDLVATFHRALSPQGIFQCQTGEQAFMSDTNPMWTRDRHAMLFLQNLGQVGFHRLIDYQESSTRFGGTWSFLLASKSTDSSRWFRNQAEIDLELQQRAMPTYSGEWPFHYIDGSTMESYQRTDRAVAKSMCHTSPDAPSCSRGSGPQGSKNVAATDALTISSSVEGGPPKVVAKTNLEGGTYMGLEECVHQTWDVPHDASLLIDSFASSSSELQSLSSLLATHGMSAPLLGERAFLLDMGNDIWQRQCFETSSTESLLEPVQVGVPNPMLERYWRIHDCAARRLVEETVLAGTNMMCQMVE